MKPKSTIVRRAERDEQFQGIEGLCTSLLSTHTQALLQQTPANEGQAPGLPPLLSNEMSMSTIQSNQDYLMFLSRVTLELPI